MRIIKKTLTILNQNNSNLDLTQGEPNKASPYIAKNTHETWFASQSTYNAEYVLNHEIKDHEDPDTKLFMLSLAVAAGNIYRLLLGETQPELKLAQDNLGEYWRISKQVEGYTRWTNCIDLDENNKTKIMNGLLISGTSLVEINEKKLPLINLTKILIAGLFLNDVDFNPSNFGLIEKNNCLIAVKIDPECCFYPAFLDDKETLKNKLQEYLTGDNHSSELWNNIIDNVTEAPEDITSLFTNENAKKEKFDLLRRIKKLLITDFTSIVDK